MVSKLKMNFVYKKESRRVLFAQVQEDFILFLLSVLTFPVGIFVELKNMGPKNPKFGCMGNLYKSIEKLNLTTPFGLFFQNDPKRQPKKSYTCSDGKCRPCFSDSHGARCPKCKKTMTTECFYVVGDRASSSSVGGGYPYAVMDNLVLKPRRSMLELLQECGVKNVEDVEEREVVVEKAEVLNMLRASLKSDTVLTDELKSRGKKA